MSDKILQKYTARNAENGTAAAPATEVETIEDLGAFGWLRGIRDRALMLELRKRQGNSLALGYFMLEKVAFHPSEGITLHFAGQAVRLTGRNLGGESPSGVRLLQGILRHRVPWIQEANEPALMRAGKSATVIEAIEW